MSLSKIFKHTENKAVDPFILESISAFGEMPAGAGKKVGGNILSLEREAYEKGFTAGEKAGFELGVKKAEVLFNGLSRVLDELTNFKESIYKPCEREILELSLAVARRVIQREVEKKDAVLDCVREALKAAVAGGEILIKVNPKDLHVLLEHKGELARYGEGIKGVKIEGDEGIGKGGCLIDTNYGEIDATVESALQEIEARLKSAY